MENGIKTKYQLDIVIIRVAYPAQKNYPKMLKLLLTIFVVFIIVQVTSNLINS